MKSNKMNSHAGEWQAFKAMPFKKKLEHIGLYYYKHILVVLAILCVLGSLISMFSRNSKEILISGMFVNNETSQSGYARLREDYLAYRGTADSRVELVEGREFHYEEDPLPQNDAATAMIISGMVTAGTLDYIITDTATARYLDASFPLRNPVELLPEGIHPAVVENDRGEAIALDLSGTALYNQDGLLCEDSCIVIFNNSGSIERIHAFLQYIYSNT